MGLLQFFYVISIECYLTCLEQYLVYCKCSTDIYTHKHSAVTDIFSYIFYKHAFSSQKKKVRE